MRNVGNYGDGEKAGFSKMVTVGGQRGNSYGEDDVQFYALAAE